ncbi:MAG TPA: SprT-like domain-containing protein [Thermoanaerobaculia bacterium]|nr:SprT-like domain-containing protein [Thermoanaerobaculia bacterium]
MEAVPAHVQLDLFPEPRPERASLLADEKALQARYDALAVRFGLPPARVVVSLRRATGGVIQYGPPHVIRVSAYMTPEDRIQTLLHETAHAVCHDRYGAEEGHSGRFWKVARQLGVVRRAAPETDRLRAIRAANARYAYRCPGCSAEWTRRTPFGRARLCAACDRAGRPSRLVLVRRPRRRR